MDTPIHTHAHAHTHTHTHTHTVDNRRLQFISEAGLKAGEVHSVRQNDRFLFDDIISLYKDKAKDLLLEYPFRIQYTDGRALDVGGVARDMFSAFWEIAYLQAFDGGNVLIPAIHPHMNVALFPVLGTIISHGYISCGFLPIRISFPVLASCLKGPDTPIPDLVVLECFMDYVSTTESVVLQKALKSQKLVGKEQTDVVDVISRFGCREMPTANNLNQLLIQIAKHEFQMVPIGALYGLNSGVPITHKNFWDQFTLGDLYMLYRMLNATPAEVIADIEEPSPMKKAEQRVFGFLKSYIGNMSTKSLRLFLRFVTGSSVRIGKRIKIQFNNSSGLAHRPCVHTCSCSLELPITYATSVELSTEFDNILSSENAWVMDSV